MLRIAQQLGRFTLFTDHATLKEQHPRLPTSDREETGRYGNRGMVTIARYVRVMS